MRLAGSVLADNEKNTLILFPSEDAMTVADAKDSHIGFSNEPEGCVPRVCCVYSCKPNFCV